jgi:hypothetical protein
MHKCPKCKPESRMIHIDNLVAYGQELAAWGDEKDLSEVDFTIVILWMGE